MAMEKVDPVTLKQLQEKYKFQFGQVKGSEVVQIIKNESPRFELISMDDFLQKLTQRGLAVYKSPNDFLKIMKDK